MNKIINLHKLATLVGWVPIYKDNNYTNYEYVQYVYNIEKLCHILKVFDDLTYEDYLPTFEAIVGVLPKKLLKKINKLTKKCDEANIDNVLDLVYYEVEEYRQKTTYNKLFTYGNLVGVDIVAAGYTFCYNMSKNQMRKILSMIESSLPVDLAPTLGKLKKLDYKIGYVKQHGVKK